MNISRRAFVNRLRTSSCDFQVSIWNAHASTNSSSRLSTGDNSVRTLSTIGGMGGGNGRGFFQKASEFLGVDAASRQRKAELKEERKLVEQTIDR